MLSHSSIASSVTVDDIIQSDHFGYIVIRTNELAEYFDSLAPADETTADLDPQNEAFNITLANAIKRNRRRNNQILLTLEDVERQKINLITIELVKKLRRPFPPEKLRPVYKILWWSMVFAYAASAIPTINHLQTDFLVGASTSMQLLTQIPAACVNTFIQVCGLLFYDNAMGPRWGYPRIFIRDPMKIMCCSTNMHFFRYNDGLRSGHWLTSVLFRLMALATSVANSGLILSQGLTEKNITLALCSFPGALLIYFYCLKSASIETLPRMWETITQANALMNNPGCHFRKALANLSMATIVAAFNLATIIWSMLIASGFTGPLAETILDIIQGFIEGTVRDQLGTVMGIYAVSGIVTFPLALFFVGGIFAATVGPAVKTVVKIKRGKLNRETFRDYCLNQPMNKFFTIMEIIGVITIALPSCIASAYGAVVPLEVFLHYFGVIINDNLKIGLSTALIGGQLLSSGQFAFAIYQRIKGYVSTIRLESLKTLRPWSHVLREEQQPLRPPPAGHRPENVLVQTTVACASLASFVGAAIVTVKTIDDMLNSALPQPKVYFFQSALDSLVTTLPLFASVGMILSFLLAFITYAGIILFCVKPNRSPE